MVIFFLQFPLYMHHSSSSLDCLLQLQLSWIFISSISSINFPTKLLFNFWLKLMYLLCDIEIRSHVSSYSSHIHLSYLGGISPKCYYNLCKTRWFLPGHNPSWLALQGRWLLAQCMLHWFFLNFDIGEVIRIQKGWRRFLAFSNLHILELLHGVNSKLYIIHMYIICAGTN